jgi:hypothetical protein
MWLSCDSRLTLPGVFACRSVNSARSNACLALNKLDCRQCCKSLNGCMIHVLIRSGFSGCSCSDTRLILKSRGSPPNASPVVLWLPSRYLDLSCRGLFPSILTCCDRLLPEMLKNVMHRMLPSSYRWLAGRFIISTPRLPLNSRRVPLRLHLIDDRLEDVSAVKC